MTALPHPLPFAALSEAPALRAEVLEGVAGFATLRSEWNSLFDTVEGASWCFHPEVFHTWLATLRPAGNSLLLAVRDRGGRLRGLMPLMRDLAWRGPSCTPRFDYDPRDAALIAQRRPRLIPVRQLTPMGSMPATMLWVGPLCLPSDRDEVCAAISAAIMGLPGWDVTVLPVVEGEDEAAWLRAFAAQRATLRQQPLGRLVQDLRRLEPFDEVVARQKWKFRQNVRRARAAAEKAGVSFTIHEGREAVMERFGVIQTLARESWKHEGREGTEVHIRYAGDQQRFFEGLLSSPQLSAQPALGVASDAQGPIAVFLMLRHGSTATALLTFWNGRQAAASPGLLLNGATIDWAHANGARHYDLNATASWVRHIADSTRVIGHVVVFSPGLRGRFLAALSSLTGRLR